MGARDAVEQAILVSVGAAALTRDRVEQIVHELAARGAVERADVSGVVDRVSAQLRGSGTAPKPRMISRLEDGAQSALRELGVAERRELEELRVRVAELERRLALLERSAT